MSSTLPQVWRGHCRSAYARTLRTQKQNNSSEKHLYFVRRLWQSYHFLASFHLVAVCTRPCVPRQPLSKCEDKMKSDEPAIFFFNRDAVVVRRARW